MPTKGLCFCDSGQRRAEAWPALANSLRHSPSFLPDSCGRSVWTLTSDSRSRQALIFPAPFAARVVTGSLGVNPTLFLQALGGKLPTTGMSAFLSAPFALFVAVMWGPTAWSHVCPLVPTAEAGSTGHQWAGREWAGEQGWMVPVGIFLC